MQTPHVTALWLKAIDGPFIQIHLYLNAFRVGLSSEHNLIHCGATDAASADRGKLCGLTLFQKGLELFELSVLPLSKILDRIGTKNQASEAAIEGGQQMALLATHLLLFVS